MQLLARNLTRSIKPTTAISAKSVIERSQESYQSRDIPRSYSTQRPSQNLLRFPAIPLEETISKFLKSVEPILSDAELTATRAEAKKFLHGEGAKLQQILEKTATASDNWLADRWLRAAYLQYRDPVCVFSSPGMAFPTKTFQTDDDFLRYTSQFIFCMLKYKQLIDENKIPVQKMGKFELDNSQFERVFGTSRIPGIKEDNLVYYPQSKHIVVIYKNHFYKLPVYSFDNKALHPDVILSKIKSIFSYEKEKGKPIGILSSDNRDLWGQAYRELISIPGNMASIREIQKALFTVSLDQEVPVELGLNELDVVSEQLIHGGGSKQNGGNRWFDKTIQVIVNRNGVNGFTYEHSPAEGQPIALMTDYIIKSMNDSQLHDNSSSKIGESMTKLNITSSPNLDEFMEKSKENIDKLADDLHMKVLHYKGYGKGFLKHQKLSPDSFIQMAMQYAFYKLHKVPGPAYESAHLRIYVNGRTETIRSCSNESVAFAKSMLEPVSDSLRVELLRKAVNGHREYTSMALQGRGVDRHLLGLKLMALENNLAIPDLYKSPGFMKSAHFRLSTSQVASANEAFMCYGPLTHDGYGCCYNPRENDMFFAISSWHSNSETCSKKFAASMTEALDSMMLLLCRAGENPKSKL